MLISHSHFICWSSKTCRFVYHVNPQSINNKRRKGERQPTLLTNQLRAVKATSDKAGPAYYRLLSVHNRWTARQARLSIWLTHCRFTPPPTQPPNLTGPQKTRGLFVFYRYWYLDGLAFHAPLARDGAAWVVSEDRQMFLERDWLNPFETKGWI